MMNLAELANRKMKFRPSFGLMMRDLLLSREDVVFLVADSARACRFECPESCQDRLVECGIAEQNMIGVAARPGARREKAHCLRLFPLRLRALL